jgi:RNA polymerase sigma factor (TIGR02999 family)
VDVFEHELTDLTRLLGELRAGNRAAMDEAIARTYHHLRRVAARQLGRERPGHTLHPTALVHEAYMRLSSAPGLAVEDRAHFMAIAGRAMRQILVDHARARRAARRGGDQARTTLDGKDVAQAEVEDHLVQLDAALDALGARDERARTIVEHRFFLGFTESETAALLGISEHTVRREWVKARAWLHQDLGASPEAAP